MIEFLSDPFRNMSQFHGMVLQWVCVSYFICSSTDRRFVSLLTWSYFILTFDMLMCPRCLGDSDHLAIDQTPQGWVLSGVCAGQLFNNPTHHRTAGHQSPPATVSTLIGNQWGNTTHSLGRAGCTMKHETSAIFHLSYNITLVLSSGHRGDDQLLCVKTLPDVFMFASRHNVWLIR